MRSFLLLLLASLSLLACGRVEDGLDDQAETTAVAHRSDAIVGGHVTFGFPRVFSIYMEMPDGSAGTCSSTLVGRRTLLTAAHCIKTEDKTGNATYVDATNATVRRPSVNNIEAALWQANPEYARAAVDAESGVDVALVKLTKEPFVRPMTWNTAPIDNSIRGNKVTATGYGLENGINTSGAGTKRTIVIPLVSVADRTIVTGTNVPLSGTCFGDSGGPILYTFPDGVTRVIGVNSKLRMTDCGPGTAGRPDVNDAWLRMRFDQYDAPVCGPDNECVTVGCATPDPDCDCVADGQCSAACVAPSVDPDCAAACAADGVCATVTCALADPDCAPIGSNCGRDAHCASRMCRDSAQHPEPYCTQSCSATVACPSNMECDQGTCRFPILPTAGIGEACTPGATLCEGPEAVCTVITTQGTQPTCRQRCLEPDDCGKGFACVDDTGGKKACAVLVQLPPVGTEELKAGCSSAPGAVLAVLALVFARRRRQA